MRRQLAGVAATALALTLVGCSDGGETATPGATSSASPTASTPASEPSADAPTAGEPTAACVPYPTELATPLVTDPATGQPRVPGPVGAAFAVASPRVRADGQTVYAIAVNVGGKAAVVAHTVPVGQGPETDGPFSPVNPFSAQATGLPDDPAVTRGAGPAVDPARNCALGR